jgi:Ca-activated chloride channel family protein
MRFAYPFYFFILLLLVPLVYFEIKKKKSAVRFSDLSYLKTASVRGQILRYFPFGMMVAALVLISFALARPQQGRVYEEIETKGVDIILCLDISTSMAAEDFKPNRLEVAKTRAEEFIEKRTGDRIGLVIFARDALTQCPLTFDHQVLKELVSSVDFGVLEDGTAVGMGLATAVARLKDSKAKEKMVILLTDGVNNAGEIDPVSAAKLAQTYNIKVYCIGVGSTGKVPYPVHHPVFGKQYQYIEISFDMETLTEIARLTEGQAFLASDETALKIIYEEIDRMEPTTFKTKQHTIYSEKAGNWMLPASILLLLGFGISLFLIRRLP